jgi:hypothetical protein
MVIKPMSGAASCRPLRWVLVEHLLHSASAIESMLSNGPNASVSDVSGVVDDQGLLQWSNESYCD